MPHSARIVPLLLHVTLSEGDIFRTLFFVALHPVAVSRAVAFPLIGAKTAPLSVLAGCVTLD
ncbi:MAG: hypothetical protein AB8B51_01360 [Sedimentitalea sp.]